MKVWVSLVVRYIGVCLLIGPQVAWASDSDAGFSFIGRAYEPETGALLYIERHEIQLNAEGRYQRADVIYKDDQENVFARKTLNYGAIATLPSTEFKELDTPFLFQVTVDEQGVDLIYQDEEGNNQEKFSPSLDHYHVVDAGFDRLVAIHWQTLASEEPLVFSFLAVTRGAFYSFRLVPSEKSDSENLVLKLEPNNAILRWILDPAYLTYDRATKRLSRFEGLTNIRKRIDGKVQNENYVAVIEYDYL